MATTEDEIAAMFDIQREVIAKAALAGCRFERVEDARRIGEPGIGAKRGWVPFVQYRVVMSDGSYLMHKATGLRGSYRVEIIALYEDEYAAAVAAVAAMEKVEPKELDAFKLDPGNEQ